MGNREACESHRTPLSYADTVRFLRRSATDASDSPADPVAGSSADSAARPETKSHTSSKGRPTPKRREAESKRRGPVPPPPRTQREAFKRSRGNKDERRKAAADRRQKMMAGDDRYLLPRDRGPVRAYVRDLVDSRRNLLGLFMPMALLIIVVLLVPSVVVQQYVTLGFTLLLIFMFVEGVVLGRLVTKAVRQKFPEAPDRSLGLGWYSFVRATQLRRLRVPKPRVNIGDSV